MAVLMTTTSADSVIYLPLKASCVAPLAALVVRRNDRLVVADDSNAV